jgi:tetratricopeptide (TPR) repeat protein
VQAGGDNVHTLCPGESSDEVQLVNINFGILGTTALFVDDHVEEDWGTPRIRALLATLLVHAGRAVPHETLTAWMWPENTAPPDNPDAALHTHATRLRRSLENTFPTISLRSSNGSYRLDADKTEVDYHHFRSLTQLARNQLQTDDPRNARRSAERALRLWRGQPLQDLSSEPAMAWRTRVENEWVSANTVLLHGLLQLHEFDIALAHLDGMGSDSGRDLSMAPVRLSALYGVGRSADADEYYIMTRRRLLHDGDDVAAERLRNHHEQLRVRARATATPLSVRTSSPPRQLRHDATDFVGRADLLRELDDATTSSIGEATNSVVAVDGMAGVGKTALVVHWAHRNRRRFPDGDFFINLHGFSGSAMMQPSAVVDDLLIALQAPPDHHVTARAKELLLARLLAGRRTLVILDNARNSAQVEDLVPLLCSATVVITSRQRLTKLTAASAARQISVPPLNPAESGKLFDTRLGSRRQVSEENQLHLVDLCGGLPLLITVLAERLAAGPEGDVGNTVRQLGRREMITDVGEDGDGPAVPETFLSWSYDAMSADEQRLFRLLSVHPGADIGTAAACACDGRTRAATQQSLRRLVGAHLLERPTLDRYQFHDVLRELASHLAHRVDSAEDRHAAEGRLIRHYLDTANRALQTIFPRHLHPPGAEANEQVEHVSFPAPPDARDWFDRERANLTATIHQAAAHDHGDLIWRLVDPVATFFDRRGYYDASRSVRELAVPSARASGLRDAEASTLIGLGMVQLILGDHNGAYDNLNAGLHIVEATGNKRGQGSALHQLARLALQRGDPGAAVRTYRRCLEVNQSLGDIEGLSWTNCRIGSALRILDQYDDALQHLHEGRFHAQQSGDDAALASCLAEMGAVYRDRGDYDTAARYCEQALQTVEAMPVAELAIETEVCLVLAEVNTARGNYRAAMDDLDRVDDVIGRTHSVADEAHACDLRAEIHFKGGEVDESARFWRRAAELYGHVGNPLRAAAVERKLDQLPSESQPVPEARTDRMQPKRPGRVGRGLPDT